MGLNSLCIKKLVGNASAIKFIDTRYSKVEVLKSNNRNIIEICNQ